MKRIHMGGRRKSRLLAASARKSGTPVGTGT